MKPVSFEVDGQKLTGTLFYPEQIKTKNPAILFLHGWKSSQKRMIPRAQQLAKLGFICLSFNLRGHGDSEGDRKILSRKDYVDDVIAAYDFLVQQAHVDKERMGIICTSFGAYLGSILTSKRKVKWLVLHAPAGYPDEGFTDPKPEDSSWTIPWR
ncbi:MAG: alpha/beta hydrolase family protein, partial [Candidatus Levyibacteriota bacterium]